MALMPRQGQRTFRRGEEITVPIDRLAYGGRGVGRVDGFVVFVPDTAPGDRVRARLWRVKARHADADLIEIESPSGDRAAPPCPYFGPCGGCAWQHVTYAAQVAAKEQIVREILAHLAGLRDLEILPILPMADPWRYRNKMEFTFHPAALLGLHRRGAFDKLVAIDACLVQPDAANVILRLVRDWAAASGLSLYDPRARAGLLRQVIIRVAASTGEIMVGLITTAPEVPGARAMADLLLAALPGIAGILHGVNPGLSDGLPLTAVSLLAGRPYIVEEVAGIRFRIGLETFFQTNTAQAGRLVEVVETLADLTGGETVYDLYCGVGTFSLPLARRARRVHGVEITSAAVEAARENSAWNGISNVEFVAGDVRRELPDLVRRAGRPDVLVLDPPRSGAGRRVMQKVIAAGPARIVYVSCNPTTLAADLSELVRAGYAARLVQPLDLFPQTYHVECVVLLSRMPGA
jgi:23S rRNA (uracil1939-C5)-methyltransferase